MLTFSGFVWAPVIAMYGTSNWLGFNDFAKTFPAIQNLLLLTLFAYSISFWLSFLTFLIDSSLNSAVVFIIEHFISNFNIVMIIATMY